MTRSDSSRSSERRPSAIVLLLGLFLLPCIALAAFGVKTTIDEARREDVEFSARARTAADAYVAAAAETVGMLRSEMPNALRLTIDAAGGIIIDEERPTSLPQTIAMSEADRAQIDFQRRRVDQLLASRTAAEVLAEIDAVAERSSSPAVKAWAVWTIGRLHAKDDARDEARAAFRRVLAEWPTLIDERGVERKAAAEAALLELGDGDDLWAIDVERRLRDACRDYRMTSTGYILRRVAEINDARAAALTGDARDRMRRALDRLRADDRAADRKRRVRSLSPGAVGTLAGLAPGETASLLLSGDPLDAAAADERWIFAADKRSEDGPMLRAATEKEILDLLGTRGDVRGLEGLGFGFALAPAAGPPPANDPGTESVAMRRLDRPLDDLAVHVIGANAATRSAAARARRSTLFAFVGAAVLFAFGAAWFTARALMRESALVRDREQFVAAVTHELKAPTASIRLLAEILEPGTADTQKTREFAAKIVAEADRLGGLVESVLLWAKQEHAPELFFETVDLAAVVADAVERIRPAARARGCTLVLKNEAVTIRGDAQAIARAVLNLIDNAIKYADTPHEIEVQVEAAEAHVIIRVLDRGRGVPESERDRIFRPFTRVGDEMTRDRPGVGLGLALVRRTAAAHGGDAWCEPRPGGGSIFSLRLARRLPGETR